MELDAIRSTPANAVEVDRLSALRELRLMDTPPEERFDRITRLAREIFDMPIAAVSLIGADRQFIKSGQGAVADAPRAHTFCGTTVTMPTALIVADADEDPRFSGSPLVTGDPHLRFYAGFPLTVSGGHRIGALCVMDTQPREFGPAQVDLLEEMARWVELELSTAERLDHASAVQQTLTAADLPELPGFQFAELSVPTLGLRGDFADWRTVPDGIEVTLGDVMNKGEVAGLLAATVRATVRALARHVPFPTVVTEACALVEKDLHRTDSYATLFHARLNRDGWLEFLDAGLGLMVVVRAWGGHRHLPTRDLPFGIVDGSGATPNSLWLEIGDTVLVFTDGLLGLWDGSLRHLSDLEAMVRSSNDAGEVVARLGAMAGEQARTKDITALVIRRVS
ncbi:SpoIIE family protein phosphatase [Nakamurella flavida]|uniref:SpoIIE family protein phosphatase n=1 Tax=Nakamurella flavida TaxID=363630 RepID=A0A938YRH4_9ACTN|nr:SpoIIE family protein phosphatase [Nakamurella flavida]MBM9478114.1 SpoIIE family protein phosphatase [Nakamurella flavida]MDP9778665.1 hypothetical protein [Nakamurella flavida]